MSIDGLSLAGAAVLLLPPAAAFQGRRVRHLPAGRDWDGHWRWILAVRWHWLDLLRGALGAWLLQRAIPADAAAAGWARFLPFIVQAAVLWPGVLLQTVVCRDPALVHAPFTWVVGVVAVLFFPTTAALALSLTLALAGGLRTPPAFFPILAASLGVLSFLLSGTRHAGTVAVVAGCLLLPTFASLLLRKPLAVTYQRRRSPGSLPPRR